MASAGSRVFVIGGESSTISKPDDPSIIHVLETSMRFFVSCNLLLLILHLSGSIKYPESSRNTIQSPQAPVNGTPQQQPNQAPSQIARGPIASRAFSPQQNGSGSDAEDVRRNLAASPTGGRPARGEKGEVISGPAGPMQPFPIAPVRTNPAADVQRERMRSPVQQTQSQISHQAYDQDQDYTPQQSSEDDEVVLGSGRSREGAFSPDAQSSRTVRNNARSPTPTNGSQARAMSPTTNGPSPQAPAQIISNRLAARSPSPVVSTPPPGDAFHYGARPAPAPLKQVVNGSSSSSVPRAGSPASNIAAGSVRGSPSNEVLRDLRAKDAELESARRRETWMRAALLKARSQGFVWGDQDLADALRDTQGTADGSVDRQQLQDLVLKFRTDYARMEVRRLRLSTTNRLDANGCSRMPSQLKLDCYRNDLVRQSGLKQALCKRPHFIEPSLLPTSQERLVMLLDLNGITL